MSGATEIVAMIAAGWEHAAMSHRADAERYRADGNAVMAAMADAYADTNERHAAQLRSCFSGALQ